MKPGGKIVLSISISLKFGGEKEVSIIMECDIFNEVNSNDLLTVSPEYFTILSRTNNLDLSVITSYYSFSTQVFTCSPSQ